MHSEKHRYWKGHQRDLRLQSDEPSSCSPQFSTIVLSSWMFARTECRCLTEEHKGRHGPYATPPIMGHMRPHHDCIPWFYFHPLQHLFSDLMWNLNTFYLIFPVAVPFLTGFLCMTLLNSYNNTERQVSLASFFNWRNSASGMLMHVFKATQTHIEEFHVFSTTSITSYKKSLWASLVAQQ